MERGAEQLALMCEYGLAGATRLLEIESGSGEFTASASEQLGVRAWGVDSSPALVAEANARKARGVGFRVGSATKLPFRDAWFDAIVLRILPDSFSEVVRVLEPGGLLFLFTPSRPSHLDGRLTAAGFTQIREASDERLLVGALPTWPHSRDWGYYPSGGLGLVLVILLILVLLGRI